MIGRLALSLNNPQRNHKMDLALILIFAVFAAIWVAGVALILAAAAITAKQLGDIFKTFESPLK